MKILFFIESLHAGGKERRLVELLKGLSEFEDISMELVLTRRNIHYTDILNLNIKIHYIERKYLKKDPRLFFKFFRIARKFKPDIIHAWGTMVSVYAILTAKLLNIKFINGSITNAMPLKKFSKIWLASKTIFPLSDIIVANSKAGLKVRHLKPTQNQRVIYNGYDFERNNVKAADLRSELEISSNSLLVGMIGRFDPSKDYKTYIKVAVKVFEKRKNVHFLCVGDGVKSKNIAALVLEKQIQKVHFLGNRSDIESICKNLDIGILLNNTNGYAEGLSNTIIEMMASGLPVIATDAGGTPELIDNGIDGFLVEPFDIEQIVNQIKILIDDKDTMKRIGIKASAKIKERFGIEKMIGNYVRLYNEIR